MSWPTVALGDAVVFKGGGTPSRDQSGFWGGSIPWATVKDLNSGYALRTAQEFITEEGLQRSASNLIPAGTVVIPTRMALGKAVVSEVDIAINQDLKAVFPVKELDTRFLLWFFIASSSRIEAMGKGATVKGVTLDQLRSLKIPLPPISEQRRIAAILDKADALRAKRREAIAKLDQLLQSVFLDMFGDETGDRFPVIPLSEAFWFQEGPGVRKWQFTDTGVKLLNVGNIEKDGTIDLTKTDRHVSLEEAHGKYRHFLVDAGDLVIASSGISFDVDGFLRTRGAFVSESHLPLCMNTSTIRFKSLEGKSSLRFLQAWIGSIGFRKQITRLVTGSAQQNFGPSHLRRLFIPLPPLKEQDRFSRMADRIEQERRVLQKQMSQIDSLFASLQHRAFSGTL